MLKKEAVAVDGHFKAFSPSKMHLKDLKHPDQCFIAQVCHSLLNNECLMRYTPHTGGISIYGVSFLSGVSYMFIEFT